MLCLSARPHENVREGFLTLAFEVLGPRESASVTADRQHMAGCLEGNSAIPEYLTVEETARRDRVSAPTIYRRCADGSLPHIRLGDPGPIRIPVSQLERAKCGESFTPRRMGRPRKFCRFCTPRSAEDKEEARAHWNRLDFERRRRHAEVLRGYHNAWKARMAAGGQ